MYEGTAPKLQSVFNGVIHMRGVREVMKWLFRTIALILLIFISVCIFGAFIPQQQRVDASTVLDGDVYSVYEIISDLRSYPEWSGVGGPESEWVFGGADVETGQTAAWESEDRYGSLEILQTEPGKFVIVKTNGPLGEQTISLALSEAETGTNFLIEAKHELGGFPYLSRIASLRQKSATQQALERALDGLSLMVEP